MHRKCVSVDEKTIAKIALEVAVLHVLDEKESIAITNRVIKLLKQNGYGIVSTK